MQMVEDFQRMFQLYLRQYKSCDYDAGSSDLTAYR